MRCGMGLTQRVRPSASGLARHRGPTPTPNFMSVRELQRRTEQVVVACHAERGVEARASIPAAWPSALRLMCDRGLAQIMLISWAVGSRLSLTARGFKKCGAQQHLK